MRDYVVVKFVNGCENSSWFENVPSDVSLNDHMQRKYHVSFVEYTEQKDIWLGVGIECKHLFESGNVTYTATNYRFEE